MVPSYFLVLVGVAREVERPQRIIPFSLAARLARYYRIFRMLFRLLCSVADLFYVAFAVLWAFITTPPKRTTNMPDRLTPAAHVQKGIAPLALVIGLLFWLLTAALVVGLVTLAVWSIRGIIAA